jgi:hypothetical protein
MTEVLQCPYCDLRFTTRSELEQHKAFDHPQLQEEADKAAKPDEEVVQPQGAVKESLPQPEKRGFLSRLFKRS